MIEMNSKERVITTLNHEEPDRVPLYLSSIDSHDVLDGYGLKGALADTGDIIRKMRWILFWRRIVKWGFNRKTIQKVAAKMITKILKTIGIDFQSAPVCLMPIGKSAGFGLKLPFKKGLDIPGWSNMVDEFGRVQHFYKDKETGLNLLNYIGGIFENDAQDLDKTIEAYEKWAPLDPDLKSRYYLYDEIVKVSGKDGPYFVPGMGGLMEVTWEAFGFETFTKLLYERYDFIDEVFQNREDFAIGLLEHVAKRDVEYMWIYDDYGYKTGPFISPRYFDKLIFPRLKNIVNFAHKNGIKIILHSCGNLNKILNKIVETGIVGLNPLEPAASMDPFQIKKEHGDKITLIGNVDPIHLLAKGTPEMVEAYVKKLIKYCAPGGGLIVSSGHSINPSVSYENYRAMIEAVKKFGTYPIDIAE